MPNILFTTYYENFVSSEQNYNNFVAYVQCLYEVLTYPLIFSSKMNREDTTELCRKLHQEILAAIESNKQLQPYSVSLSDILSK